MFLQDLEVFEDLNEDENNVVRGSQYLSIGDVDQLIDKYISIIKQSKTTSDSNQPIIPDPCGVYADNPDLYNYCWTKQWEYQSILYDRLKRANL